MRLDDQPGSGPLGFAMYPGSSPYSGRIRLTTKRTTRVPQKAGLDVDGQSSPWHLAAAFNTRRLPVFRLSTRQF